ncbi:MAG: hypothetical protein MJ113_06140 [Lachnospiraceae bacterium]|nr:hypothetical protein [Lachnospiraceae bacterium]
MQERLKELPKKILLWWNKYSTKQKTIIVSIAAGVVLLLGFLIWLLSRMNPVDLYTFETTKAASNAINALNAEGIDTRLGDDNLTVQVDESDYSKAILCISTTDGLSNSFTINDLLDTSISTTNSERIMRNNLYLQANLKGDIESIIGVDSCTINYLPKDSSTSILSSQKDIPASVMLITNNKFKKSSAESIAVWVAYAIGNSNADLVKVMNQTGELLFNGPEDEEKLEVEDKIAYINQIKNEYIKTVTAVLVKNGYTDVSVGLENLVINFDKVTEQMKEYTPAQDQEQGLYSEFHQTTSEGTTASGGVVGTDGNDEQDYYTTNGQGGTTSTQTRDIYYLPNYVIKDTIYDTGVVDRSKSSIAITLTKSENVTEEDLRLQGYLDDMTYEEFQLRNKDAEDIRVPDILYDLVSSATGIPVIGSGSIPGITITAKHVYNYVPTVVEPINWTLYLEIALAALILGFLVYVVFRGMTTEEIVEFEPELSVEQLLATTKENQSLEDVEFSGKSEIRKMIEKFFDENPESVSQLLRNWLNEDWE